MDLDDERWSGLSGGYGEIYDPRDAIRRLEAGDEAAWDELWQELHHQGDIGIASYAAVPELVRVHAARGVPDWNTYAYAATIEEARRNGRNPALPDWLRPDYESAWQDLQALGLAELAAAASDELIRCILAVLALGKGQATLARMALLTEDERQEMLGNAGLG